MSGPDIDPHPTRFESAIDKLSRSVKREIAEA